MVIVNSNNFRTEYHPKPTSLQINHSDRLFTVGSCFSETIGQRLHNSKFSVDVNPFGTVYNPMSIFKLLTSCEIDERKLVEVGGQYYHHDFHSKFTARDEETLMTLLSLVRNESVEKLKQASFLFITLGTAYVYELKSTNEIVSNCHKVPQREFDKRLLTLDEMSSAFQEFKAKLEAINPDLKIIFTLSPVRHIKDGLVENQLSKSILRVCCHEWSKSSSMSYFPSYEMMIDDLRDYRFYKNDMIHPSEMAEDYLWEKFQLAYFSNQTQIMLTEWDKIRAALSHRPFNPMSDNHQKFLRNQLTKLDIYSEYFDVTEEKNILEQQLLDLDS
ncbi:MAG: GSCFA domain-containing protein [Reichenbachiella sp.]|uniref:GSCFA domain-containing protein n=1 Tax=Reichenbachiella sp. TaxID=2184521 RepID=UPI003263B492